MVYLYSQKRGCNSVLTFELKMRSHANRTLMHKPISMYLKNEIKTEIMGKNVTVHDMHYFGI